MNSNVGIEQQLYSKVARVKFHKSLYSFINASTVFKVQLIVCSEFNEPIQGILDQLDFQVHWYRVNERFTVVFDVDSGVTADWKFFKRSDILHLEIFSPIIEGLYMLRVSATYSVSHPFFDRVLVMPVLSDKVNVVNSIADIPSREIQLLLKNYRTISSRHGLMLAIIEDYGVSLGSHLYDSSIILFKYIETFPSGFWQAKEVIELGAGCGLIGIYLGQLTDRTAIISDKQCQRLLIEANISVNDSQSKCQFLECDWSIDEHVSSIMRHSNKPYDYILATDVLYDVTTASLFFDVVRRVAHFKHTIILLAQKIRDPVHAVNGLVDVSAIPGFTSVTKVHSEANVVIWSLLSESH